MSARRRLKDGWGSLEGRERAHLAAMLAAVIALNALGWAVFALVLAPRHLHLRGLGLGMGAALTAWTLGCRHAFDADHIAAIDNTTRKLMADGRRPLSSGFWFSLGHSSVVMLVGCAIAFAARPVFGAVVRPSAGLAVAGGLAGTLISGAFLWLVAALNLIVLVGIVRVILQLRAGGYDEAQLEARLRSRGLMSRFFSRWLQTITRSRQLFFVGFAFGIGFDTATEVVLLAGAAAAAAEGVAWYAVLALPLLFAGGMTIFDTADGLLMNSAYGWAFARPVRKLYYNVAVTGISIAVAFLIGAVEIGGLLIARLHLHGWLANAIAGFNLDSAGYLMVGLFAAVWLGAAVLWRLAGIEGRLATRPAADGGAQ